MMPGPQEKTRTALDWETTAGFNPTIPDGLVVLFAVLLLLAPFLGLGAVFYGPLDHAGWITHNHDTPVWIKGDWMVGEYRDCGMLTTAPPAGAVLSQGAKAELPRLLCGKESGSGAIDTAAEFAEAMPDMYGAEIAFWGGGDWSAFDSYFHVLPVRYNGRIDRPDKEYISWHCQRASGSLTCWALD